MPRKLSSTNRINAGRQLKQLRLSRGLTQSKLGEHVDVTGQHIGNIERGESSASLELLRQLADFFGVPLTALDGREAPGFSERQVPYRQSEMDALVEALDAGLRVGVDAARAEILKRLSRG